MRTAVSGRIWGLDIPEPDNLDKAKMLIATNVARKMALDMRLLGDKFRDDENNKASICARTIYDYYVRSNANRGYAVRVQRPWYIQTERMEHIYRHQRKVGTARYSC